jgi:hypothetical protein
MKITKLTSRTILDLVFKPTLSFTDNLMETSKPLEAIFDGWSMGRAPDSIMFLDNEREIRVSVSGGQLELVVENVSEKEFVELFAQLFSIYFEDSDITKFSYIGVQNRYLYETDTPYKDFTEHFYETYYGNKEAVSAIFADTVTDVTIAADGIKDGFSTRIQFGPVKQEQLQNLYPKEGYMSQERKHSVELSKETGVYIRAEAYAAIDTLLGDLLEKTESATLLAFSIRKQLIELLRGMQ